MLNSLFLVYMIDRSICVYIHSLLQLICNDSSIYIYMCVIDPSRGSEPATREPGKHRATGHRHRDNGSAKVRTSGRCEAEAHGGEKRRESEKEKARHGSVYGLW